MVYASRPTRTVRVAFHPVADVAGGPLRGGGPGLPGGGTGVAERCDDPRFAVMLVATAPGTTTVTWTFVRRTRRGAPR